MKYRYRWKVVNMWVSCSHGRSYEYYSEALKSNCTIWGHKADLSRKFLSATTLGIIDPVVSKIEKCDADTCIPLGLEALSFPARGSFVASTSRSPPYCETNPEVTKKILSEIKSVGSDVVTSLPDALSGSVNKGKDITSVVIGKVGSLRRL